MSITGKIHWMPAKARHDRIRVEKVLVIGLESSCPKKQEDLRRHAEEKKLGRGQGNTSEGSAARAERCWAELVDE
jgi:hypothetical protein